jgi:hypothetical protein
MPLSSPIIALTSQLVMLAADRPPNFNIGQTCRLDLTAAFGQDISQQYKSCVSDEQNARQQLQRQWPTFPPAMRTSCASQESIGGTPSYVSLLTCLQMSNWK